MVSPALGAAIATVFGVKLGRAGKSLFGKGKQLFKRMNPEAKPMKVSKPKKTSIKTAKPVVSKPNPIKVEAEERKQVLGDYYGLDGFKPGASLKPKESLDKPLGMKDVTRTGKTRITKTGKAIDKKKQPLTVFDREKANKAVIDDLKKEDTLKLFR